MARLLDAPRFVAWGIRIDTAPAGLWLLLLALALWPTGVWMVQRMLDGSDDPLGALALAALGALAWRERQHLRAAPRLGWWTLATLGVLFATLSRGQLPPLLHALLSLLTWGAGLIALLPTRISPVPVLGLTVLSLPLLASLQFYLGYPLRVLTAEASRWLLSLGHSVSRSGASLVVDGQLVLVDAPCSGVQMVWMGYFCACVVALYTGRSQRAFLTRLPAVSLLVLGGNILRNTALVALQADGQPLVRWAHEGIGLVLLAAVCTAIAAVMGRAEAVGVRRAPV